MATRLVLLARRWPTLQPYEVIQPNTREEVVRPLVFSIVYI